MIAVTLLEIQESAYMEGFSKSGHILYHDRLLYHNTAMCIITKNL